MMQIIELIAYKGPLRKRKIVYLCPANPNEPTAHTLPAMPNFTCHLPPDPCNLAPPPARHYHSDLSIWLSVDPMADKYPSESPYQFCGDNTIVLKDPNGQEKIICFSTNTGDSQQDKSNQNLIDAANSKATEDPVIHLFAHGIADNNGFCWGIMACDASGAFELSSPQDVHRFLLCNSEVYKTNQYYGDKSIVVLHSCKTGQEGSIAEKTSRTYGNLLVIAPSDNLNVSTNSKESCETGIKNNGKWILYYKGEMMDSFYDLPFIDDTDAFIHKYEKQYENDHPKTTFD